MSNIVDRPPTKESGMYIAPSHKEGGVKVVVDNTKVVEVEGGEWHICREAMENGEILQFTDKTNKQILDAIFKRSQCVFEQGKGKGKDFIVCKLVVQSPDKRTICGTAKEIINTLQSEHSCKVSSDATQPAMQDGGNLTGSESEKADPIVVSAGLALVMDGKILLGHRAGSSPDKHFGIPKGRREGTEDSLMTALREAQEEIGLTLRPHIIERLKGQDPHVIECRRQGQYHVYKLIHYYVVPIENIFSDTNLPGEIVPDEWLQKEEMDWAGFVPLTEARKKIMITQMQILDDVSEHIIMQEGGDLKSESPMSEPAYLMTLSEYQQKVTPLLLDYFKFIKKNDDYLKKSEYYGLYYYTYPEVVSRFETNQWQGSRSVSLNRDDEYGRMFNDDQLLEHYWDADDDIKNLPAIIQITKDEFIKKISRYFPLDVIYSKFETDEKKSNKRSVKRAIEDDTYKKLLEDSKVEFSRLKEIADSVGVKIPNKVIDARTDAGLTQEKYEELYKNIPRVNYDKLKQLRVEIDESFKDFAELIFTRMRNQYVENIGKIGEMADITKDDFDGLMPYGRVYAPLSSTPCRTEDNSFIDSRGKRRQMITKYYTIPELSPDYMVRLEKEIRADIKSMKFPLLSSILENFQRITKPIASFEKLYVELTPKSRGHVFEGAFRFTFENDSAFTFVTQAITAGGWNIQRLHLRYLTHFHNVVLQDGSMLKTDSLYQILDHFSDKLKPPHEIMVDRINESETMDQLLDNVVFLLKTMAGSGLSHIRKGNASVSLNVDYYRMKNGRLPRYVGFSNPQNEKELMDFPAAKQKAIEFITNYIPVTGAN